MPADNRRMFDDEPTAPQTDTIDTPAPTGELAEPIDRRDELIRLLNEALARALDELAPAEHAA